MGTKPVEHGHSATEIPADESVGPEPGVDCVVPQLPLEDLSCKLRRQPTLTDLNPEFH